MTSNFPPEWTQNWYIKPIKSDEDLLQDYISMKEDLADLREVIATCGRITDLEHNREHIYET
jgi:chlorite dismutase